MRVKLKEDFFVSTVCDLQFGDGNLLLRAPKGRELSIPFQSLKRVGLEGSRRKHFRIETDTASYEGSFLSDADAAAFIGQLRTNCDFHVDVRLDEFDASEPSNRD